MGLFHRSLLRVKIPLSSPASESKKMLHASKLRWKTLTKSWKMRTMKKSVFYSVCVKNV